LAGIISPSVSKVLLTTTALSMAVTPFLSEIGGMIAEQIENRAGFSHYVGADAEGKALRDTQDNFVVVCGYGRIGKMVCDLLDKKFIPYVAFDVNPSKVRRPSLRGLRACAWGMKGLWATRGELNGRKGFSQAPSCHSPAEHINLRRSPREMRVRTVSPSAPWGGINFTSC
jgi:hypothetical protein